MLANRERLPNRRAAENFNIRCSGMDYVASVGKFRDGRLAEIFIAGNKAGSAADASAKDSAVVASIALQYGAPIEVLRHALLRDPRGVASSPLGAALDLIVQGAL